MSRKFKIVNGVRQGSIFFPFLFNLAIDWILEKALSIDLFGNTLDDMVIADLVFSDDICLIDKNGIGDNITNNALRVGL